MVKGRREMTTEIAASEWTYYICHSRFAKKILLYLLTHLHGKVGQN